MTSSKKNETLYLIHFRDPEENKTISLKARYVGDSTLGLSFVRVSDFVFDTSSVVVKPTEEQLQKRFDGVKSIHISIYNIISIEEIGPDHNGLKFKNDKSNLVVLASDSSNQPSQ